MPSLHPPAVAFVAPIASPGAAYGRPFRFAPRAKPLPRTLRLFRARILDTAMRVLGVSNGQLARWCGVDEKLVRRWRSGDRAIAAHHVDRMRSVGVEYAARLATSTS